jgi:hypothetical protein
MTRVERVDLNALRASWVKPLDKLGALSRFDKLKALSKSKGSSNGPLQH